jgi:hypothetical protein
MSKQELECRTVLLGGAVAAVQQRDGAIFQA